MQRRHTVLGRRVWVKIGKIFIQRPACEIESLICGDVKSRSVVECSGVYLWQVKRKLVRGEVSYLFVLVALHQGPEVLVGGLSSCKAATCVLASVTHDTEVAFFNIGLVEVADV